MPDPPVGSAAQTDDGFRALIVEDEPTIAELLRIGLTYEGWRVVVVRDGTNGLRLAVGEPFDLVILDVMLPELDGWTLLRRLRDAGRDVPVILLTARGDVAERVAGLDLGADDYVVKPFAFEELLARIRAVLRRRGASDRSGILSAAGLTLDHDAHEVFRDGQRLDLTPIEFALLEFFMRHPRRAFSRATLFNRVWGFDRIGDSNVVDVHVRNLRDKIGDRDRRLIRAVYGIGYSFRPDDDAPAD